MLKPEFVAAVADNAGVSGAVAMRVINAITTTVVGHMSLAEPITLGGIGSIAVGRAAGGVLKHPFTKKVITYPARGKVIFKPSDALKKAANKAFWG